MQLLSRMAATAATIIVAGCGSGVAVAPSQKSAATSAPRADPACSDRSGFELSLARQTGGRPTPLAAANWFARHGGIHGMPGGGWRLTSENQGGATLTSGQSVLHAIRGSDGTWQVDSGHTCTSG